IVRLRQVAAGDLFRAGVDPARRGIHRDVSPNEPVGALLWEAGQSLLHYAPLNTGVVLDAVADHHGALLKEMRLSLGFEPAVTLPEEVLRGLERRPGSLVHRIARELDPPVERVDLRRIRAIAGYLEALELE